MLTSFETRSIIRKNLKKKFKALYLEDKDATIKNGISFLILAERYPYYRGSIELVEEGYSLSLDATSEIFMSLPVLLNVLNSHIKN